LVRFVSKQNEQKEKRININKIPAIAEMTKKILTFVENEYGKT